MALGLFTHMLALSSNFRMILPKLFNHEPCCFRLHELDIDLINKLLGAILALGMYIHTSFAPGGQTDKLEVRRAWASLAEPLQDDSRYDVTW